MKKAPTATPSYAVIGPPERERLLRGFGAKRTRARAQLDAIIAALPDMARAGVRRFDVKPDGSVTVEIEPALATTEHPALARREAGAADEDDLDTAHTRAG